MNKKLLSFFVFACTFFSPVFLKAQSPGDITVVEVMQNPLIVADNLGEWFELHNNTNVNIDINAWSFKDNGSDLHVINNGGPLIVPRRAYITLGVNGTMGTNGGLPLNYVYPVGNFQLANADDEIILKTPGGVTIDSIAWDGGIVWPDPDGKSMVYTACAWEDNNLGANWIAALSREANYDTVGTDLGSPQTQGNEQILNFVVTSNVTQPSCGLNNGAIDLTVTGCGAPYNFIWSTGPTTEDLSNLSPGNYTVTITATIGGYGAGDIFTLDISTPMNSSFIVTDAGCPDFTNGSIDLTVGGGANPIFYEWSNSDTTQDLSGISPGTYFVTITDFQGCVVIDSATVGTLPGALNYSGIVNPAHCTAFPDGSIDLSIITGVPSFSFAWSTGDTTEDISGLIPGFYSVTVQDAGGCIVADSFFVDSMPPITINFNPTDVTCFGYLDGMCEVTPSGGTPPYSYLWSDGQDQTLAVYLSGGMISIIITDSLGCSSEDSILIFEPAELVVATSSTPETGTLSNGTATATPSGGTSPYTYAWSNTGNTGTITGIPAGTYYVTVTDANGCSEIDTVVVSQVAGIIDQTFLNDFEVFPLPATEEFILRYKGIESINEIHLFDNSMKEIALQWDESKKEYIISVRNLPSGIYFLRIKVNEKIAVIHVPVN